MKNLLQQSGHGLAHILEQAELYQALLEIGQNCLPSPLNEHLIGVSFEDRELICQIDDNLWSTQLRFYMPEVLSHYQRQLPHLGLTQFRIQVLPIAEREIVKPVAMEKLTEDDSAEMQNLSQEVKEKGLQKALQKLSARMQKAD